VTSSVIADDRLLIKALRIEEGWTVDTVMIAEFPARQCTVLNWFYWKCWKAAWYSSVRIDSNIQLVNDLICSQEGQPGTSKSPREIARETVFRILLLWGLRRTICNSRCFDTVKFSPWQQQTNLNDWIHANVWRNVWHGTRSVVLGSRVKRLLLLIRLLTARTIAYTPVWKQNVTCRQVDCWNQGNI